MYRIGVDIGGTFTDCVVVDDAGGRSVTKSLTTHGALPDGVLDAVTLNAEQRDVDLRQMLSVTSQFVHGTTVATNSVLTRKGAKTGLVITRGHEHALIIGKVIAPLDESSAINAIDELLAEGVEAIAVSLLWSFINNVHEQRIKTLLSERAPGVFTTFSHELAPVLGEYERTVTTVLNAYVGPEVSGYLRELEARLNAAGLARPLLVMQASDGLTSVADASVKPIVTLDSGPTGGILGCHYLSALYSEPNMICTDVGGTSFDVGLSTDGQVPLEPDPVVAQYSYRIPKVSVRSIGAGGGSVGWLDEGGVLRVGPQSAGSRPGPACYGLGGDQPTVTDADLVLGYFDAEYFLGGRMRLDRDRAFEALAALGARAAMSAEEVAIGMVRIINAHMADLIRRTTIEQGNDPRQCVLVAYGGAGPTHAAFYGTDIGAKSILIPADSTVFSAEGMLTCQMVHSAQASHPLVSPFTEQQFAGISAQLAELESRVLEQFAQEGFASTEVIVKRSMTVRYGQQVHTVDVELPGGDINLAYSETIRQRFEQRYVQIFGAGSLFAGGGIEYEACRVTATHTGEAVRFAAHEPGEQDPGSALRGERPAYFECKGFIATPVYNGEKLGSGHRLDGPAIIERMGDSVVVPPGFSASLDPFLSLELVSVAPAKHVSAAETRTEKIE